MARYLTPAKTSLLVLIELYCCEPIPDVAILPILTFVTAHVADVDTAVALSKDGSRNNRDVRWERADKAMDLIESIDEFEKLLSTYVAVDSDTNGASKLWDVFLFRLWAISSLDCLHLFFDRLNDLIAPLVPIPNDDENRDVAPKDGKPRVLLGRTSPFGMFVRRAQLELQRLRFHDMAELWRGLVRYRQPTASYISQLSSESAVPGRFKFDHVLADFGREFNSDDLAGGLASIVYGDMLENGEGAPRLVSTDDIEALLEFQIDQVQQYGTRIPLAIKKRFESILQDTYTIPSLTHYLGFIDAWRAGDYPTAFDLLRRYFDYTMQNRDRLFYQYALMNLAVLQADFGCYREALAAMLETVSTARENRDMTCLNFSLNWLFHFSCAHPQIIRELDLGEGSGNVTGIGSGGGGVGNISGSNGSGGGITGGGGDNRSILGAGKESLAYLRVKAREMDMWPLWSAVLLSEAKHSLARGDSVALALESITRSSHVMVEHNMTNLFGSSLSLQAALWDRMGVSKLSETACDVFLRIHAHSSLFDDQLRLSCRLAVAAASRGDHGSAQGILSRLEGDPLRSWRPAQYCQKYRAIIDLRRALHCGGDDLINAETLLLSQKLIQNRIEDMEPDLGCTIQTLEIECMVARGDINGAFARVEEMIKIIEEDDRDVLLLVRLLLIKARLYDKVRRARRGFTVVLRAVALAWKARLLGVLWEAIGLLANVLSAMTEYVAAEKLLKAVLPRALETDDIHLVARLYSFLADTRMGMSGDAARETPPRDEGLDLVLETVDKSFEYYKTLGNIKKQSELLAKKAMIARIQGEEDKFFEYSFAHTALRRKTMMML